MKSPRFLPLLYSATALLCGATEPAFAQVENPAKPSATPLEKLPEKLSQAEAEFGKKLIATRALVDAEAEAKRISDTLAQSLYWSLRTSGSSPAQVATVLESARVPASNAALTAAFRELTAAAIALRAQRADLLSDTAKELRVQVSKAVLGTPTVAEVGALEEKINDLQQTVGRRYEGYDDSRIPWESATQLLRGLRRLIEAEGTGDFSRIAYAVNEFRGYAQYGSAFLGSDAAPARIRRIMQPLDKAIADRQAALDDAIQNHKTAAEVTTAFAAFSEAAQQQSRIRASGYDQSTNYPEAIAAYRSIVNVSKAVETGNAAEGQNQLREARSAVPQLGAARAAKYEQMLDKMDADLLARAAKFREQRLADLRTRLSAVKQPADLDGLAADLQAWAAQHRNGDRQEDFGQLASQLNMLAAAWATASPVMLQQQASYGGGESARAGFAKELADLRRRIERDVLAQVLKAPELNAPPLSEKPPDAAVSAFCSELALRGDWRRLLQVLQSQPPNPMQQYGRTENETVVALRSFFAAQNFELAEQWPDAVQAYKAVLRSTGENIPVKPAAESLKALVKEHPEAAAAAALSPESRRPIPSPDAR